MWEWVAKYKKIKKVQKITKWLNSATAVKDVSTDEWENRRQIINKVQ